jgi:FkbM family methyltransferase
MKEFGGWQFPDHELHLIEWMKKVNDLKDGRLRYQGKKQDAAMKLCKQFRTAVDVGAHVGLWSYYLERQFDHVEAFEPVSAHRECFLMNLADSERASADGAIPGFTLHACALGDHEGSISISTETGSSGNSFISGDGDIPLKRLDDFNLQDVDYIKLDAEGGELPALRGGEETIKRCRPCIIVEQKPGRAQKFGLPETGAVAYLQSLGAVLRQEISGDFLMSWD